MVIGTLAGVVGMEDTMGEMLMEAESTGSRLLDGGQPTLPTDFQKAPSSPTPGQIKKIIIIYLAVLGLLLLCRCFSSLREPGLLSSCGVRGLLTDYLRAWKH